LARAAAAMIALADNRGHTLGLGQECRVGRSKAFGIAA
jgi:hypothetical protein